MKTKAILLTSLGMLFLLVFFFKVFPFPVHNALGAFGGFAFTSILFELSFKNYIGGLTIFGLLLTPAIVIKLWK